MQANAQAMADGYHWRRIAKRTLHTVVHRRSVDCLAGSLFSQVALKLAFGKVFTPYD